MAFDEEGVWVKRDTNEVRDALISALREQFGPDIDVTPAGVTRKLLEAGLVLPLAEHENDLDDIQRQMFFESATGTNLHKLVEPLGFVPLPASRSMGDVNVNFKAVQSGPSPIFAAGSLTFLDSANRRYDLLTDIDVPGLAFEHTGTGVNSGSIDGSTTRLAQRFVVSGESAFVQGFSARVNHGSLAPEFTVTIREDSVGSPASAAYDVDLTLEGWAPDNGIDTEDVFVRGAVLPPGTYWLVFDRTAGDGTFVGSNTGTADQVKTYAGSWSTPANPDNVKSTVIYGGVGSIRAQDLGEAGNIAADGIVRASFASPSIATAWAQKVQSATNEDPLEGGREEETEIQLRDRILTTFATREVSSVDGIAFALSQVEGVDDVTVIENDTDIGTALDKVFDSDETGTTMTEVLGATNTRIAQKVVLTEQRWVQHHSSKLAVDTTLVADVRLETDTAGSPSGTLAFTGALTEGFTYDGGIVGTSAGTFEKGSLLAPGTYWLVHSRTSGSGQFDGGAGGTANQVKYYNGSWNLSANVENLNMELIAGLPPHSFRAYVSGGESDPIAQKIWDTKAAGIYSDGIETGTATDRSENEHTIHFERPLNVPVVISVEVQSTDAFVGNEDDIKDAIVEYVGGNNTAGVARPGLGINAKLVRNEAISRLLDDDVIVGLRDVLVFRLGLKDDFPTPGDLTSAEVINLQAGVGEEFVIEDLTDIDVTITAEV